MRYWGKNIEIDGSYYKSPLGQSFMPKPLERQELLKRNAFFQFEGDVENYEKAVQEILRLIENNRVGKVLMQAINRDANKLRIIPLTQNEQKSPGKDKAGNDIPGKRPCANGVGNINPRAGNDSVIWFEPWSTMPSFNFGGILPQQVLVHELQHSLRQMRGKFYKSPPLYSVLGIGEAFPNAEELFSVTIENMYVHDAGIPQNMMGTYNQGSIGRVLSDKDFYKQYVNELDVWCRELPDLTVQLQTFRGIWNPFRIRRGVLDMTIFL